MAWMVAVILMIFYLAGRYGFVKADLTSYLPYVAVSVLVLDYVVARRWNGARQRRS